MWWFGVLIGVFVFGGLLAWHAIYLIPPPPSGFGGSSDYANTIRALGWLTAVFMDAAVALSVALPWGVESGPSSGRNVRLVFATVFLSVWIIFSSFIFSFVRFIG